MPMILVNLKRGLPYDIAEFVDVVPYHRCAPWNSVSVTAHHPAQPTVNRESIAVLYMRLVVFQPVSLRRIELATKNTRRHDKMAAKSDESLSQAPSIRSYGQTTLQSFLCFFVLLVAIPMRLPGQMSWPQKTREDTKSEDVPTSDESSSRHFDSFFRESHISQSFLCFLWLSRCS